MTEAKRIFTSGQLVALGLLASVGGISSQATPRIPRDLPPFPRMYVSARSSKRYPEQSTRQKLRGLRRAQGGPGLTEGLDPQPRA